MTIVIDAMGGDKAPDEVVLGAVLAGNSKALEGVKLCLVGDESRIKSVLPDNSSKDIEIVHTDEFIAMDDHPGPALRRRTKASMAIAARMVGRGEAQALVCAGNTGALHQIALMEVGRIKGIRRPALAAVLPTEKLPVLALDMGANADSKPEYLVQFALMGAIYAEKVMNRPSPRVGLLNIGTEEGKGGAVLVSAYERLRETELNFVGNVEPMDMYAGKVDVAVCDGFVGNMMLKTSEAVAAWLFSRLRDALSGNPVFKVGSGMVRPALKRLKREISLSQYGGAVLLGLKGVVVKCHGRSDAEAVAKGIEVAAKAARQGVVDTILASLPGFAGMK